VSWGMYAHTFGSSFYCQVCGYPYAGVRAWYKECPLPEEDVT